MRLRLAVITSCYAVILPIPAFNIAGLEEIINCSFIGLLVRLASPTLYHRGSESLNRVMNNGVEYKLL